MKVFRKLNIHCGLNLKQKILAHKYIKINANKIPIYCIPSSMATHILFVESVLRMIQIIYSILNKPKNLLIQCENPCMLYINRKLIRGGTQQAEANRLN